MKVNLAVQTLSSSVADALEYCEGVLNFNSLKDVVQLSTLFVYLIACLMFLTPEMP